MTILSINLKHFHLIFYQCLSYTYDISYNHYNLSFGDVHISVVNVTLDL